ncbi:hypothetical protein Goshw_005615 [Gossypium schwendimanii]|uniref:Uncharacterized protein n=1 Tax=Gossypium schwendimanii TaxID=34291 RepID=A0A7J9NCS1_GOSSC|nr:hypothetical protein [Gossypium schwendimanii]
MHARKWVRADLLDVYSFYSYGFTVTFRRWIRFRIGFFLKIIHH